MERLIAREAFDYRNVNGTSELLDQIESQLETAREVQHRLLNHYVPPIEGLDYYGECRSGGTVGRDFFDLASASGTLTVCVGDVSKSGIPAAIIVAALQATVRALPWTSQKSISFSATQLNHLVCQIAPDNFYASLFLGQIDPICRRLHYVNAGHAGIMIVRHRTNRVIELESSGPVLGLSENSTFRTWNVLLEPGDTFVALTEGVVDAIDLAGNSTPDRIVLEAIRGNDDASSADLAEAILEAADRSTNGRLHTDDRTVVVIRFPGPPMTIVVEDTAAECAIPESLYACAV